MLRPQYIVLVILILIIRCAQPGDSYSKPSAPQSLEVESLVHLASQKYRQATATLKDSFLIPRNAHQDGLWRQVETWDWTSGFFSGNLWQLYELTGDDKWKQQARKWSAAVEKEKTSTNDHDLGFQLYCSFGNELRLTGDRDPYVKEILLTSARTLMTRFNPNTGVIRSWDWGTEAGVGATIIDNMMNLELLVWAFKETGDSSFVEVALSHTDVTLKNHFRPDYTTYHVVDYDSLTGKVVRKRNFQGYEDFTTWSRGQSWAIYGYTMMYRECGLNRYLDRARKAADIYLQKLPDDTIPFWDFEAPGIPNTAKDASSAAIAASALLELATFEAMPADSKYYKAALKLLNALCSEEYLSAHTGHQGLILKSTGNFNKESEVEAHITYADYYFLEALNRLKTNFQNDDQ